MQSQTDNPALYRDDTSSNVFLLTPPGNKRGVERLVTLIVRVLVLGLAPSRSRSQHEAAPARVVGIDRGIRSPAGSGPGSSLARLEDSIALFQKTDLQC